MKKMVFLLLIICNFNLFVQSQSLQQKDCQEKDKYLVNNHFKGDYKINDSLAAVFANGINELKLKIREADSDLKKPSSNGKIRYYLPDKNITFEFFIDTTALTFEARETTYKLDKTADTVREFKFHDCAISGYCFIINHSTTYEDLEFLFVKNKIEVLLKILSDNLNSSIRLGEG